MAKLACDICGGKLLGRPGGRFECDSCGMEYDTDWAKAKIQEIKGTVKVEGTVSVKVEGAATAENLIKRGYAALEDEEWDVAKEEFNAALRAEPESSDAHIGLAMCESECRTWEHYWARLTSGRYAEGSSFRRAAEGKGSSRFQEKLKAYRVHQARAAEAQTANAIAGSARAEEFAALRERYAPARDLYADRYWLDQMGEVKTKWRMDQNDLPADHPEWRQLTGIWSQHLLLLRRADGAWLMADLNRLDDSHPNRSFGKVNLLFAPEQRVKQALVIEQAWKACRVAALHEDGAVTLWAPWFDSKPREEPIKEAGRWTNVERLYCSSDALYLYGLKRDGSVLKLDDDGTTEEFVPAGSGIVQLCLNNVVAYLLGNGTVRFRNRQEECLWGLGEMVRAVEGWSDLIQIDIDRYKAIGLKADGTLLFAEGKTNYSYCSESLAYLDALRDVAALLPGDAVLLRDGGVIKHGYMEGYCEDTGIRLFDSPEELAERTEALSRAARAVTRQRQEKREALTEEQAQLKEELANLKGFFSGKRRKEIEVRLTQIEEERKGL